MAASGLPENAFDLFDGNLIDLRATWEAVMPYLTQVRMRANCDTGISGIVGCLGLTGVSTAEPRMGAAGEIGRMRSSRGNCSPGERALGAVSRGVCGFGLKSSSAARRAFVIRARS